MQMLCHVSLRKWMGATECAQRATSPLCMQVSRVTGLKGASEVLTRLSSMVEVWLKYAFKQAAESSSAALHMVPTTAAQF